ERVFHFRLLFEGEKESWLSFGGSLLDQCAGSSGDVRKNPSPCTAVFMQAWIGSDPIVSFQLLATISVDCKFTLMERESTNPCRIAQHEATIFELDSCLTPAARDLLTRHAIDRAS